MQLRVNKWIAAAVAGAIAFPVAAVLHELGHYVAARALGFPDVVLRFSSVRWAGFGEFVELMRAGNQEAAMEFAQPWQVAVVAGAGVVVTYLTVIGCVFAVRRFGPLSLAIGVGLVAPVRFVVAVPYFFYVLLGKSPSPHTDESLVALATGIPVSILYLPGLACLLLGYWFLVRAIPRGEKVRILVPTSVGLVSGGLLWALWLGPLLLP